LPAAVDSTDGLGAPFLQRQHFKHQLVLDAPGSLVANAHVAHQRQRGDIRTVQKLLGHSGVATTTIYNHRLKRGGRGVRSPLDA
jgi:integrase